MDTQGLTDLRCELQKPFRPDQIEWRLAQAGENDIGKPWAKCLAYLTNRAIMDRLDEVVGPMRWYNEYRPGPQGGVVCGITIDGVTKWDGAENSDIEAVKGGLSDAMKRAAVQWGIGRYLYGLDEGWAICSPQKASGPEWRYQAAKNGKHHSFYWQPPELPQWALPADVKAKTRRTAPEKPDGGEPAKPAPAVRAENPFGIPPEAWLRLDAVTTYAQLLTICGEYKDEARRDGWVVGLNRFFGDRSAFLKDIEDNGFEVEEVRR